MVCPLSVLSSWNNELEKWAPSLKCLQVHGSNPKYLESIKQEFLKNLAQYDILLTTYDMIKTPTFRYIFTRVHFHYLVLDEGHKIKNHEALVSQAARRIHKGNSLILTGTPLQNNLVELWSLLNFMYPEVFSTSEPFEKAFNLNENIVNKDSLADAQKLLDLFMLRRLKSEVELRMPKKLETKVLCPLSKTQTFWYKSLLLKDLRGLEGCEAGGFKHTMLRNLFMELRKCCNHPFLFPGAEVDIDETSLEDLVSASGKLSVLDMLLQSLFKKGNRCIIFSQFTQTLNIIEDYCQMRGWKYARMDGGTSRARRNLFVRRYNEPESPYFLFLISTRAGGMGLNLQSADTCILYDSDCKWFKFVSDRHLQLQPKWFCFSFPGFRESPIGYSSHGEWELFVDIVNFQSLPQI